MVDYSKPCQMGDGQHAEVLAKVNAGAWVTWGTKCCAYFFDRNGNSSGCSSHVYNVPEKQEYYARLDSVSSRAYWPCTLGEREDATHRITIQGDDCRIEKL